MIEENMNDRIIDEFELKCTCYAYPEQYDVFKEKEQIGYIRIRYGKLSCRIPDHNGKSVYNFVFNDIWKGEFYDEKERKLYLNECVDAIKNTLKWNIVSVYNFAKDKSKVIAKRFNVVRHTNNIYYIYLMNLPNKNYILYKDTVRSKNYVVYVKNDISAKYVNLIGEV